MTPIDVSYLESFDMKIMIEKGKKCTIKPDNHVSYEITEVKSKTISIKMDDQTIEETYHFVDLKEVNGNSRIEHVPVYNINLLND